MSMLPYHLALCYLPGYSSNRFYQILNEIADIRRLFYDYKNILGLNSKQIAFFRDPPWKQVEIDLKLLESPDIHFVHLDDSTYPAYLKQITTPPHALWVMGSLSLISQPQIAIVGSRKASPIGIENAKYFAQSLTEMGMVVTSGLAEGIDAAAHQGALSSGKTIAVIGTGISHVYPWRNRELAAKIRDNGAIVSEFAPNAQARAYHFPQRNRIISGLSLGTLVVEAAPRSGSLITARYALEQGREVFAIPGSPKHSLAQGCHQLIQHGAKLVQDIEDISSELSVDYIKAASKTENVLNLDTNDTLVAAIDFSVSSIDKICERTGLKLSELGPRLLKLEQSEWIQRVAGGYIRCK